MDSLSIKQRRSGDVAILDLTGKLTIGGTNQQLAQSLRRLVAEGERSVILDLSGATYVDSTGLGELVAGYSTLKRNDGRLALIGVPARIMDLMTITKLYTVFDIYDTEAEGVESFQTAAAPAPHMVNASATTLS